VRDSPTPTPGWNALDAVRGQTGTPVASLGFFYARDVTPAFATDDSARVYARRATRVRVVAATMTDAGADAHFSSAVWWYNRAFSR